MTSLGRWARPWRVAKRWLKRLGLALAAIVAFYAAFLVLGFIPICMDYTPPPADDRVRIFIRTNEIHTDFVLPVESEISATDWHAIFPPKLFRREVARDEWVAIGWGSRKFFVETPTWGDLTFSNFCLAMFTPNEAVLHVEYLRDAQPAPTLREIWITRAKYRELVGFLKSTLGPTEESGAVLLASDTSYGRGDRFFQATGAYNAFNTCNQWTGRGLARAGVPTGLWTPLKEQVLWRLPATNPIPP